MGELVVLVALVLIMALVFISIYRILREVSKEGQLNDNGAIDENAVILTNIVIKFQNSKRDAGIYTIDKKRGVFAVLYEFKPDWATDDLYMKHIYKFTEIEVQCLKRYGTLEGEDLKIVLRTPII